MPDNRLLIAVAILVLLVAAALFIRPGGPSNAESDSLADGSASAAPAATTAGSGTPRAHGAVVLMYHRFGEDRYPATNIRIEQFEAHLAYLQDHDFQVLPLPEIVAALRADQPLPERAVAITVDDAYRSALLEARPRLEAAGFPWTLFVTTDQPDGQLGDFMSWDEIRELDADPLVTIGHHSGVHHHMPDHPVATNRRDTEHANRRFEAELGHVPDLFAYPFGEYSDAVLGVIREFDFVAAFGQHSGVVHADESMLELPRFAMNENWGRMDRFEERVHTRPLPLTDIRPSEVLVVRDNPPTLSFTLADPNVSPSQVGCFPSGGIEAEISREGRRISVTPKAPFPAGRARINCTAPYGDGTFRWYGRQFVVREPDNGGHLPRSDPGAGTPE